MKEYLASRLVRISSRMTDCFFISMDDAISEEKRNQLITNLDIMDTELGFLGLEMTRISVARIKSKASTIAGDDLVNEMGDVEQRFLDEIQPLRLLYIPPDKRNYFSKTDLFGEEFKNKFPTANAEVIEAGNCFALGRFTACVYHLCRAMEIGLRVLFVSLGMPPRIWSTTKWNHILDRIKGKIDKNNKTLANDYTWQNERGFYENAHAFLAAVRVPIRNSTMHVESVYDETGAENVFGAAKTFMRHLATKLSEVRARPGSGIDSLPRTKKP